jgi:hypothetical protein
MLSRFKRNIHKERLGGGDVYLPKGKYKKGQVLVFLSEIAKRESN